MNSAIQPSLLWIYKWQTKHTQYQRSKMKVKPMAMSIVAWHEQRWHAHIWALSLVTCAHNCDKLYPLFPTYQKSVYKKWIYTDTNYLECISILYSLISHSNTMSLVCQTTLIGHDSIKYASRLKWRYQRSCCTNYGSLISLKNKFQHYHALKIQLGYQL